MQAETSGTVVKFLADNKSMVTSGQVSSLLAACPYFSFGVSILAPSNTSIRHLC